MKYEIWLGDHYSHFDHGLLHEDGQSKPLEIHIRDFCSEADSVLLADHERCEISEFPVRWFAYPDGLEFYCWDVIVESVVLHNHSSIDLMVRGYGVLQVGESREYTETGRKKN